MTADYVLSENGLAVEHATSVTADLLTDVTDYLRLYVALSDDQAHTVALWTLHTHAFAIASSTPYLAITSAEPQSGKTRLLEVLDLVCARSWYTSGATASVLVRKVNRDHPTLLLDETDAAFGGAPEYQQAVRGILNSGYREGGRYDMSVMKGKDYEPASFDTFCPKGLAGIGQLPDTVASRAIPIRMKRRAPDETVSRFKRKAVQPVGEALHDRADVWVTEHGAEVQAVEVPDWDKLTDRAFEVWEPLLQIATVAGADWHSRATTAALALSGPGAISDTFTQSNNVLLLGAVRDAFKDRSSMFTGELLAEINGRDDLPFGGWGHGHDESGIGPRDLAKLLGIYGVVPDKIRRGKTVARGYHRHALGDAWTRYLPPA